MVLIHVLLSSCKRVYPLSWLCCALVELFFYDHGWPSYQVQNVLLVPLRQELGLRWRFGHGLNPCAAALFL